MRSTIVVTLLSLLSSRGKAFAPLPAAHHANTTPLLTRKSAITLFSNGDKCTSRGSNWIVSQTRSSPAISFVKAVQRGDGHPYQRQRRKTSLHAEVASSRSPPSPTEYFMSLFQGLSKGGSKGKMGAGDESLEKKLLEAIDGVQGRGRDVTDDQRQSVNEAVEALEANGGIPEAASSPSVDGKWRLIFTTTPGTASPVQRSFVGVDGFAIYQDIDLFSEAPPTVTNVVDFGPKVGQLRVTALASTPSNPMEGFVPRKGDGRFFGLNILGVSQTTPPKDPSGRIDFQFDEAGFDLEALPFNIPYPVPFRWLGDEVKGWIDVTYLSERLRIARGNKGTLFVLQRPDALRESSSA